MFPDPVAWLIVGIVTLIGTSYLTYKFNEDKDGSKNS